MYNIRAARTQFLIFVHFCTDLIGMKDFKLILIFSLIQLNTQAFIQSLEEFSKTNLKITEEIDDVQIDSFHEDKETTTYWYENAKLQKKINEESLLSHRPCNHQNKSLDSNLAKEKSYQSKLGLLLKYNNKEFKDLKFPIQESAKVGEYLNKIFKQGSSQRYQTLRDAKSDLSFEEKIKLASYIGKRFDSNYDFERAKEGTDASQGIVTLQQLIDGYNIKKRSGICRDIAVGQVQILNEMGLKCKVTGYETARATGHATVACSDPKDPDKTIRINYGEVMASNQSGTLALTQNGIIPATTVSYRLYDENGKFVSALKTDLGKMLTDVSGGKPEEIDWQERFNSNIAKVNLFNAGQVFYGETVDGQTVIGIASDIKGKYDFDIADLDLSTGGTFAHVKNKFAPETDQALFFFRVNADLKSKPLQVTEKVDVKAKLGAVQTSTVQFGIGDKAEDKTNSNFALDLVPALEMQAKVTNSTMATISGGSKFELGQEDFRDVDSDYMMARSADFVHTRFDHQVTDTLSVAATAVVINRNQLGRTGRFGAEVEGQSFKSTLVYDTRLDKTTPGFVPGATPTVTFEHQQKINNHVNISGGVMRPLAGAKETTLFMGVELLY